MASIAGQLQYQNDSADSASYDKMFDKFWYKLTWAVL